MNWIIFSNNILQNLDYQDFTARISYNKISIKSCSPVVRLLFEFFIEELEPGVADIIQFE